MGINYALIGFGGIAERRLAREGFGLDGRRFRPHPAAALVAAADLDRSRRGAAEALGLRWHDSVEALLRDRDIQAVFVATDNASHAPGRRPATGGPGPQAGPEPVRGPHDGAQRLQPARGGDGARGSGRETERRRPAHGVPVRGHEGGARELAVCPAGAAGRPAGGRGQPLPVHGRVPHLQPHLQPGLRLPAAHPRAGRGGRGVRAVPDRLRGPGKRPGGLQPAAVRLELERSRHTAPVRVRRIQNVYQALVQAHANSIREKRPMDGGDGLHNLELVLKCHESARGRGKRVTPNS